MSFLTRNDAEALIQALTGGNVPGDGSFLIFRRDIGWVFDLGASAFYYWSAQGTAAVASAGVYVKVSTAGSTTSVHTQNFDVDTNNRATYRGSQRKSFSVTYIATMTMENNNETGHLRIAKNGTVLAESEMHRKVTTGTDSGAISLGAHVELEEGDYVELWTMNADSTGDVYIKHGYCSVIDLH